MADRPAVLLRPLAAEGLGTALLLAMVVGSGIMAERLSGGNVALALLANTVATGAGLTVIILILGPVSGAHFNPAVTLVFAARGQIRPGLALGYGLSQVAGAVLGVWLAHLMFGLPVLELSAKVRAGLPQAVSEAVATFGLILTILACVRHRPEVTPFAVGLYITSAYWFTASTSFANPAVTLARSLSDSFAGIRPSDVAAFVAAQMAGAALAVLAARCLFDKERLTP